MNMIFYKSDNPITSCEVTARQHHELQAKFRERKENVFPDKINSHSDPCEETQNKILPASDLNSETKHGSSPSSKPIR